MKRIAYIGVLLFLMGGSLRAQNPDINMLRDLNVENASEDYAWRGITNSYIYVPTIYVVANFSYGWIAHDKRAINYGVESLLSIGIGQAVNILIKKIVRRPRPTLSYPRDLNTYSYTQNPSFPSGHSTLAFSTATTMAMQFHRPYVSVPIFAWSTTIGYSRMRLGKHFPSDVLVGILVGIGGGLLAHWATNKIVR